MDKKPIGIYVDLDCLLDTRLGTLMSIDSKRGLDVLDSKDYYLRDTEEFPYFSSEEFQNRYDNRDTNVLKHSTVSNIIIDLKEMIVDLMGKVQVHPLYNSVKLFINISPYSLTEDEKDTIIDVMRSHTFYMSDIEIIDIPLKELSCLWVYENVSHLFIYHYDEWLNGRSMELSYRGLPDISLYIPRLYFSHRPTEDDYKPMKESGIETDDYFIFISELFKSIIILNFLPVNHFCVLNDYD